MRYTKRIYHNRQPRVGDTIECTYTSMFGDYTKGNELTITEIASPFVSDNVRAYNPRIGRELYINDSFYRIYTDITYVKTGKQHIVKRFLGIPYYRKTIDIYEEELTHD